MRRLVAVWIWMIAAVVSAQVENVALDPQAPIVGIGARLSTEGGRATIMDLVPDGPAAKDGRLDAGDVVMAVAQGKDEFVETADMALEKVIELIRGKKDTIVRLQVLPANAADAAVRKVVEIRRDLINAKLPELRADVVPSLPAGLQEPPGTPLGATVLRWRNGEAIAGEVVAATATDLTWKTPLFEDPLVIQWRTLRRIDRQLPPTQAAEAFSFILRDGSHIYGDLVSISDTAVRIRSARHGDATLKRSEVLSMRRLHGENLVFAGPAGDVGWDLLANRLKPNEKKKASPPSSAVAPLVLGPAGALTMPYWNRGAFMEVAMPVRVEVEFRVRSSGRPDFQLALEAGSRQRLRIETWDEALVLTAGDQFKLIRKITDDERELALRVCWDTITSSCSVFTPAGQLVAEWSVPEDKSGGSSALVLQSKGRDLSLEFLSIRKWDREGVAILDLKQPRVELADGRVLANELSSATADMVHIRAPADKLEGPIPLNQIDAVIFSADVPQPAEHGATVSYADGTYLVGEIAGIKDPTLTLTTSFSDQPLSSQLTGLRQILVNIPGEKGTLDDVPLADLDKLVIEQTTLHGKVTTADDQAPRWLPVGGVTPSTPARGFTAEMSRAIPTNKASPTAPALFYMSSGDVLAGNFRAFDRTGVEFDSSVFEARKLSADNLDAIQFDAGLRAGVKGFDDPQWVILKGDKSTVRKDKDSVTLPPTTSIGHADVMHSSELQFSIPSQNYCFIRLRLFCAGLDPSKATNVIVAHMGNQVYSGIESTEGQFGATQVETRVLPGKPISVDFVINERQVELHLNGALTNKFTIAAAKRAGSGLIIEPASLWGNTVQSVTLTGLSTTTTPGRAWLPDINLEAKAQALTVPRFRRDDPPKHALLAANGDVLRGEIEAATASQFGFRSGLENLKIPRGRVKAAIWLKPPTPDAPAPVVPSPTLKLLEQRIENQTTYSGASLQTLLSTLQRVVGGLKFKLPEKQDNRRFQMQFGGQTAGEALDQICALYDVRYHVGADGTISFTQTVSTVNKGLVQKSYWLKTDPLPKGTSLKDFLVQKGLSFPPGASASWQAGPQQLTMTNNAGNHARLTEVIDGELGGTLGSPTHWLILTSGARFGLAVDHFGADFITGHHPIYGRCKVPMGDVYTIRNTMPEPTTAMKSLADWRLTFAPEPVLPETGGESSPMLGKEAKSFKLPLLDGGEFDLAKEKGKVVVLDFWATWCGPCIKSLPGLIDALGSFPDDRVKLIGMNQSEPPEQVKRFLETRGWKLAVALDAGQTVARQYGVEGIPHTVIVGPDGKIAWVKTGYSADGDTEAANAVKQLLGAADAAP